MSKRGKHEAAARAGQRKTGAIEKPRRAGSGAGGKVVRADAGGLMLDARSGTGRAQTRTKQSKTDGRRELQAKAVRAGRKAVDKTVPKAAKKNARKSAYITAGPGQMLENGHWERFCQLMSEGRFSQKSCYAQCYPGSGEEASRRSASDLLTKPDVLARIQWLKAERLKNWQCEKEEVMQFLHAVVMTPVGYVDEESPLAQEVTWEESQSGGARGQLMRGLADSGNEVETPEVTVIKRKVKLPDKKACAELLAKMQGWEKPKEVNLNLGYEPPSKAMERAKEKGVDVLSILQKAGIYTARD